MKLTVVEVVVLLFIFSYKNGIERLYILGEYNWNERLVEIWLLLNDILCLIIS